MHGEAGISHGTIRDGVGAAEMHAYLEADALTYGGADEAETPDVTVFPDGLVISFAALSPTVRVAEGTSAALIDETVRVVQAINAALPQGWQLGFDPRDHTRQPDNPHRWRNPGHLRPASGLACRNRFTDRRGYRARGAPI